jgi:hypothetical protein
MRAIEDLLIGLVGKPILWLIKWLRWALLFWGFYFNAIYSYNPHTRAVTLVKVTYAPFIVGLILFAIGLTVKRYDERYREYMRLVSDIEFGRIAKDLETHDEQTGQKNPN